MYYTGITRRVDELGRIVLPAELRRNLDINTGDALEILTEDKRVILQKAVRRCVLCGESDDRALIPVKGKYICDQCRRDLGRA